jgi:hypothetical protein
VLPAVESAQTTMPGGNATGSQPYFQDRSSSWLDATGVLRALIRSFSLPRFRMLRRERAVEVVGGRGA